MPRPALRPVPDGMSTLTTHLFFDGSCTQAIELYQKAFGAELAGPAVPSPDGQRVMHAMMKIGNSHVMMADAWPGAWEQAPKGSATAGIFVYVDECDKTFDRA